MFGLFDTMPQYAGNGQPAANSSGGAFGFLGGLLAFPGTPKYATADVRPTTATGAINAPAAQTDPETSEQVMAQYGCPEPATTQGCSERTARRAARVERAAAVRDRDPAPAVVRSAPRSQERW